MYKQKSNCIDCGKEITFKAKRCRLCWKKNKIIRSDFKSNDNHCIDCQKSIAPHATRCVKCQGINFSITLVGKRKGKDNSNYKHGECNNLHYCKVCSSQIVYQTWKYGTGLCMSCSRKGRRNGHYGRPASHGIIQKYKDVKMRSSYEVLYAKYLDKNNVKWQYESKTFDLGDTTYTPDFYLPESDTYIEIKGWWRDKAKEKFNKFKKYYKEKKILLLMKQELNNLGVL